MILWFKCWICSQSKTQTSASCASLSYQMQTQPSAWAPGAWLTQGTNWRTAGWSWTWEDREDVYRRGKHWREKMITALLCLIREFCFQIVKGFINIKFEMSRWKVLQACMVLVWWLWCDLLCECEIFWKHRSTLSIPAQLWIWMSPMSCSFTKKYEFNCWWFPLSPLVL